MGLDRATPMKSSPATCGTDSPRANACSTCRSRSDSTGPWSFARMRISPASPAASSAGTTVRPRATSSTASTISARLASLRGSPPRLPAAPGTRRSCRCARRAAAPGCAARRGRGAHHAEPVDVGHLVVHERDVRVLAVDGLEGLPPVARLGHDLDPSAVDEAAGDPVAEERVVVGHHDAHAGGGGFHCRSIGSAACRPRPPQWIRPRSSPSRWSTPAAAWRCNRRCGGCSSGSSR